jgi:hypothetical protein
VLNNDFLRVDRYKDGIVLLERRVVNSGGNHSPKNGADYG